MENVIIVRYGEIGIKSRWVRKEFENILIDNLSRALVNNNIEIEKISKVGGRIYVWCSDIKGALKIFKNVFGIVSYSPAEFISPNLTEMKEYAIKIYKKNVGKKFRITTTRRDKKFPLTSMEISSEIGAHIVENMNAKVDLNNYELNICFEINENDAYVFSEFYEGYGGLPIGTQGKVLCYISEKKESEKNAFLMARRGCEIILAGKIKYLHEFSKKFEKQYYHFKESMKIIEMEEFNFEDLKKIAKMEDAKAIVLEKSKMAKFENVSELPIFYPSISSELSFYILN